MTTVYGPVTDWATDFDHGDPEYNKNIHQIWETLKASGCPSFISVPRPAAGSTPGRSTRPPA